LFDQHCHFLDTIVGRGVCYLFVGTLAVQLYQPGLGTIQLLSVFAGLTIIALAVLNMIIGLRAMAAQRAFFDQIKQRVESGAQGGSDGASAQEQALLRHFREADADGSGELDLDELVSQ
jgi:predicted lipid-binding transport protein (Tim44 family)